MLKIAVIGLSIAMLSGCAVGPYYNNGYNYGAPVVVAPAPVFVPIPSYMPPLVPYYNRPYYGGGYSNYRGYNRCYRC